ncbi:hypothetical protein CC80DRAFT_232663 [Byssothecium circinans]|uniref:Uncharacterized protein n=1 Tax=Byssothecium circinans TaxID=147558 RepID=A0A6A5U8G8_9PLEO|nr:hypothetical protein CC80DRAFT_232663 [Byssothecium circinans]
MSYSPPTTLSSLTAHLLSTTHLTRPLSSHATHPSLTHQISSLLLHPSLEAALHILNADLPSAHFLVRHMQAPPAVEGMLLHSISHRCEGDFGNARAWASDVKDACEGWVPKHRGEKKLNDEVSKQILRAAEVDATLVEFVYRGDVEGLGKIIDDVENFRNRSLKEKSSASEEAIENRIREEMERIISWCAQKFGSESWPDASTAWVKDSEEIQKVSNNMVSGDGGWRKF